MLLFAHHLALLLDDDGVELRMPPPTWTVPRGIADGFLTCRLPFARTNSFGSDFGSDFGTGFGAGFGAGFGSDFGAGFGSGFGTGFSSDFGSDFGSGVALDYFGFFAFVAPLPLSVFGGLPRLRFPLDADGVGAGGCFSFLLFALLFFALIERRQSKSHASFFHWALAAFFMGLLPTSPSLDYSSSLRVLKGGTVWMSMPPLFPDRSFPQ